MSISKYSLLVCFMIFAGLGVGCSGSKNTSIDVTRAPLYARDSGNAQLQQTIFAQNLVATMDKSRDASIVGSLLAASIEANVGKPIQADGDYLSRLAALSNDDILRGATKLLGVQGQYPRLPVGELSSDLLTPLRLASAINDYRTTAKNGPEAAARTALGTKVKGWSPTIATATQQQYLNDTEGTYRHAFAQSLESRFGSLPKQGLDPNGTLVDLANALPDDVHVFHELKSILKDPPHNVSGTVLRSLERITLKDIKTARDSVHGLIGSPELTEDERSSKYGTEFHKADAAIKLAGLVIDKIFDNPKEAKEFAKIANATISAAKTLSKLNIGELGASVATGNYIGAATEILGSLFGGDNSDPNAVILDAINQVREDIADLRKDMDARFDEVDHHLDQISKQLDQQLILLTTMSTNIAAIQNSLSNISGDLIGLEFVTRQGFNDLLGHQFEADYLDCLGPTSMTSTAKDKVTSAEISGCLTAFYQRATLDAKSDTRTGANIALTSSQNDYNLIHSSHSEFRLSLLQRLLDKYGVLPANEIPANPADWVAGASSFVQVEAAFSGSDVVRNLSPETLKTVIETGTMIQRQLRTVGDTKILLQLMGLYQERFTRLVTNPYSPDSSPEISYQVSLFRELLDQVLRITRTSDRFDLPRVSNLFNDGIDHLPDGPESLTMLQVSDAGERTKQLGAIRVQEHQAESALREYVKALEAANRSKPMTTLVDEVLGYLHVLEVSR